MDERVIKLQGADNVRDLGGIPVAGGRVVAPGLLYRGSALSGITDDDRNLLFGQLRIAAVVDLRTGWELAEKPDTQEPGVEYLHIPFYDLEKVGIEYTEPAKGTKVIGRDVACEPVSFYRSLANPLTVRQMRDGVAAIFGRAAKGLPVYLHCSGGKDRAGVMSMLLLTVLGASEQDILDDYLLTNVSRDENYPKMFERFLRLADGDEERARELVVSHRALPQNMDAFRTAVADAYGDMKSFVRDQLGISDAARDGIRSACTIPA